tara:strand:- start:19271 stop:20449 length:1179 start_codon:yes stop_codon:yes gene_type:complete
MKLKRWPKYTQTEIEAALNVLSSGKVNYWTGSECKAFEKEFANYIGSKFGVALANGTVALEAAYKAIGLTNGDEIITTPRTFIATSMAAINLGAKPIFADVDINTGCISQATIEPLITKNTKAISVVHIAGWPADMENICKIADKYNLYVIEDCSQAHGAKIKIGDIYKSVGSFGDLSCWSFCQDKIISTAGEGGMITTNDQRIYQKVWSYKDHGKSYQAVFNQKHTTGYKYLHEDLGSNYRMTEMQASIGRIQLKNLNETQKTREKNAAILISTLNELDLLRIPIPPKSVTHAWYKFYAYINEDKLSINWSRDRIIDKIIEEGYPAYSGSCSEIYMEKCIYRLGMQPSQRLNNARNLGETSLAFLVDPLISVAEMHEYAENIKQILISASK